MSYSFDGSISEFPGIRVDKFNKGGQLFLLTHCHADHLVGLEAKSFSSKVYCSSLTKQFIALNEKYSHILPFLISVEFYHPLQLILNGSFITITLILSYHCPGSSMFLIEGASDSVLVTGDIRADHTWVESLKKIPCLFPYTCAKTLLNIYFDSTFTYRGEPYIEIPPNSHGFEAVLELIKLYPCQDPDIQFVFLDQILGFEESWCAIVGACNGKLIIDENLKQRFRILQNDSSGYLPCWLLIKDLLRNNFGPCFNVRTAPACKFPISIRQCINFNIVDLAGVFFPIFLDSLTEDDKKQLVLVDESRDGHKIYKFRGRNWLLPKNGDSLLPNEIKLLFSRHSSYTETRHLISLFKPKQVFPCSESKLSWLNGASMKRLFGDLCRCNDFEYDNIMFKKYGNPNIKRAPVTINRWSPDECEQEFEFVMAVTEDILFPFKYKSQKNNFLNRTPEAIEFQKTWSNDMKLQKLIAGRGEAKFKQAVEKYQKLYYNRIQRNRETELELGFLYEASCSSDESSFASFLSEVLIELRTERDENAPSTGVETTTISTFQEERAIDVNQKVVYLANKKTNLQPSQTRPSLKRKMSAPVINWGDGRRTLSMEEIKQMSLGKTTTTKTASVHITRFSIDENEVNKICFELRHDPTKWYQIKLESIDK